MIYFHQYKLFDKIIAIKELQIATEHMLYDIKNLQLFVLPN